MKSAAHIISRSWCVLTALSIMFFCVTLTSSFAQSGGAPITSFSADMVMITPDGEVSGEGKLYVTPEAYRMDGLLMGAGEHGMPKDMTFLGRKDQNTQYFYNHDRKLVYQAEFDEDEMMKMLNTYQSVDSEVVLGREEVSGYSTVKKEITTTTTVLRRSHTIKHVVWQSDRFEMPLRTRNEEGYTTELRNIIPRKPSAELFEPLTGYRQVGSIMAVMGLGFLGGDAPAEPEQLPPDQETGHKAGEEAGVGDMMRDVGRGLRGIIGR